MVEMELSSRPGVDRFEEEEEVTIVESEVKALTHFTVDACVIDADDDPPGSFHQDHHEIRI